MHYLIILGTFFLTPLYASATPPLQCQDVLRIQWELLSAMSPERLQAIMRFIHHEEETYRLRASQTHKTLLLLSKYGMEIELNAHLIARRFEVNTFERIKQLNDGELLLLIQRSMNTMFEEQGYLSGLSPDIQVFFAENWTADLLGSLSSPPRFLAIFRNFLTFTEPYSKAIKAGEIGDLDTYWDWYEQGVWEVAIWNEFRLRLINGSGQLADPLFQYAAQYQSEEPAFQSLREIEPRIVFH